MVSYVLNEQNLVQKIWSFRVGVFYLAAPCGRTRICSVFRHDDKLGCLSGWCLCLKPVMWTTSPRGQLTLFTLSASKHSCTESTCSHITNVCVSACIEAYRQCLPGESVMCARHDDVSTGCHCCGERTESPIPPARSHRLLYTAAVFTFSKEHFARGCRALERMHN